MPSRALKAERKRKGLDTVRPPASAAARERTRTIWLSVALVALTVAVFEPVRHFSFVTWDDTGYVSQNPIVKQGLTLAGVAWALTSPGQFYWHPITWLSHMADVQISGMQAGGHHVTNLVLHVAGTLLLFGVLLRMTGRAGRSVLVAALFAVHPLHVESVAWIAERKDVLSGVFWMLTLWVYVDYVRTPGRRTRYIALLALFALGLMSKPTLVTLPMVLLLLDIWPLGRVGTACAERSRTARALPHPDASRAASSTVAALVVEKIPLFALSIAVSMVTFLVQLHVGAVEALETIPAGERVSNAAVSGVGYIGMAVWPAQLAAFYPFRPVEGWWALCCLLILASVTYAAVRARRRWPYLMVGWLWYLVTLLPVLGLIQVGSQAMADRFTYLPLIGLLIALAWGVGDLLAALRVHRIAVGASALAIVAACAGAARAQVAYWKDSETLWRRAVNVVPNNDLAHANLGLVLAAGRPDEALAHFSEALRIHEAPDVRTGIRRGTPPPEYAALLHSQIGLLLGRQGRWKEATLHFREVVRLRPGLADAHHALGRALASDGQLDESIRESREAIRLEPGRAELHGDFASVLYRAGDRAAAIAQLEQAVGLNPADRGAAKWHYNLAALLNESGRTADAIRELEAALAIDPAHERARRALTELRRKQPE